MQSVSELMTPNPIFVRPGTPLPECGQFLETHRIRHLPVIGDGGQLVGVLGDADVWAHGITVRGEGGRLAWSWHPDDQQTARPKTLMHPVELTAREDEPLTHLFRRWRHTRQDVAMVVDGSGRLVGILTEHDVVAAGVEFLDPKLTTEHAGTRSPVTIEHMGGLADAVLTLEARGLRHVVIVSGDEVRGVASMRDIALLRSRPDWARTAFVRQGPIYTVPAGMPLRGVASRMFRHKIGLVPVLDRDRRLERVISRRDIMDALFSALEGEVTSDPTRPDGSWSHFAPESVG
jgi:CBS domain-containing protein